jgi:hypothetical protein
MTHNSRPTNIAFRSKSIEAWVEERGNKNAAAKAGLHRYMWLLERVSLSLPETVIFEALNGVLMPDDLSMAKQIFQAACLPLIMDDEYLKHVRDLTDLQFIYCLDCFDVVALAQINHVLEDSL